MKTALLSVSDKTGIIDFATGLIELGWKIIASGSTAQHLREQQIPVTEVATYTQSPEMLGGRVKTLHPAIHGGILARATVQDKKELQSKGWDYIDLVVVNLYPFEETIAKKNVTFEDAIEQIDIGGVALIRAAAKNYERVTLVCDPLDYKKVLLELKNDGVKSENRKQLAIKGFVLTSYYDAVIANFLAGDKSLRLNLYPVQSLRYGENPHQSATLFSFTPNQGPLGGKLLQGKELSYNNILDLDAAWRTVISFQQPTICIVKHLSPCGIASANDLTTAFQAALECDPISAFGGVIAANQVFDESCAKALGKLFVECIIAPGFTPDAKAILNQRTNCRLLEMPSASISNLEWRSVNQGLLRQDLDLGDPKNTEWRVVSKRQPTEAEWQALRFAWQACQPVKSNAIVFAQGEATVGIGSGQPNRIDCVRLAAERAGSKTQGSVMASDAFFPFPDCVELAAKLGITAVIHPGGSQRDQDSINAADAANMSMVITGVRHFRH